MRSVARGFPVSPNSSDDLAGTDRFTEWLSRYPEWRVVAVVGLTAGLIRLYLFLTSYCISADGVAYIAMARDFHAGRAEKALAWVFSPLYPWLISMTYRAVPNWEIAGELLSIVFGTATVVMLYYLMREVFARRAVAAGAAALAAIHPLMAAFSASVRTEAGYIALMTAAMLLFVRGARLRRIWLIAAASVACGFAYLYRTEGVGVPVLAVAVLTAGSLLWKRWTLRWGMGAAAVLGAMFLLIASPYLVWMRHYTGHWTVGREVGVVTMEATGSTIGELNQWRKLGYRPATSWLTAIRMDPAAYLKKVGRGFFSSCYTFVQALGPLLFAALLLGLWFRGRSLLSNWGETTLAALVLFYFSGFVLTDTGTRLMLHVAPFTLGWVAIGFAEAAQWLDARLRASASPLRHLRAGPAIALVVAAALLPRTLYPLGYDQRGLRYAGREIARRGGGPATVAGPDVRAAFYANASFLRLPARPAGGTTLCRWLADHRTADYLMIDDRGERHWHAGKDTACLSLIKRYPRVGRTYYDLFAVNRAAPAAPGARSLAPPDDSGNATASAH